MSTILKKRVPAIRRDINLEEPPWRFYVNRLFDSLMPTVSAVSTAGTSSLKSPASIWRSVDLSFATFIVVSVMMVGHIALGAPTGSSINVTIFGVCVGCGCVKDYRNCKEVFGACEGIPGDLHSSPTQITSD